MNFLKLLRIVLDLMRNPQVQECLDNLNRDVGRLVDAEDNSGDTDE